MNTPPSHAPDPAASAPARPPASPPRSAASATASASDLRPAPPEDQFRALFDGLRELVLVLEADGRIVFANESLRTALGCNEEELIGVPLVDRVHPYDRATCQAWLQRQTSPDPAQSGQRIRMVLRGADGQGLPVEGSATRRDGDHGLPLLHAVFTNLTEQERSAHAQQESMELIQLLSQHAPWGVFITDAVGRLRFANRRWRVLADVLHIATPRGVWWQMVHPSDRDRVLSQWHGAQSGGRDFASEHRINTPDHEPRWVRTRISQAWGADGQPGACVGITEDITLQRQADDVLRQAHDQLESLVRERTEKLQETNQELTDLVYAVTHDLKAPLRGVGRLADWLAEDHAAQLPAEGSVLIVKLQARVRQMHALIDGILTYSRIARTAEPDGLVDLNQVIHEVVRLLDPPPSYTISIPEILPTVTGVHHQLHQLFQNLVDNAIKFSDKPEGRLQVTSRRVGHAWEFSVGDNGPGIPERFQQKIFNLFQRLDSSPDRPGTGIGLSLVKRIVETRGGRISVSSEEGLGTTFQFTWPDHGRRNALPAPPTAPAPAQIPPVAPANPPLPG